MGLQLLKEAREEKYTQAEIAEILGVKRGTYASWECGSDIIPAKQLGMHTIWLRQGLGGMADIKNAENIADHTVESIGDILSYL